MELHYTLKFHCRIYFKNFMSDTMIAAGLSTSYQGFAVVIEDITVG